MKLLLISLSLLVITGCQESTTAKPDNWGLGNYTIICIDRVEYIKGYNKLTPHLKTNGKPYICKGAN